MYQKGFAGNYANVSPGFTLIELMIVIAVIAIILTLAMPAYSTYTIRARVSEGLSVGNAAKTAVSSTCASDLSLLGLTNSLAGYAFDEDPGPKALVASIEVSGPCTQPLITITTKNTGASPDPVILLTGELAAGRGQVSWRCSSTTPFEYIPSVCRN